MHYVHLYTVKHAILDYLLLKKMKKTKSNQIEKKKLFFLTLINEYLALATHKNGNINLFSFLFFFLNLSKKKNKIKKQVTFSIFF